MDTAYTDSLKQGGVNYEIEHRVIRKTTGEIRYVLEKCEHFRDKAGRLVRSVGMVHDITESRRAGDALRESESFYRQTLESIPGMVFTTLPDGYCDFQSRQWEEFTGVPVSEHLGDGWNRLLHPEDRSKAFNAWRDAVEGRAPYDLQYRVRRHDGVYEWFRVIGRPIRDEEGRIVRWFGVAINIENLIQAETTLKQSNSELEYTNRELESFIYSVSHDLRGPLRAIAGFGDILKNAYGERLDGKGNDYLSRICQGAEKMSTLIDDLLRLSRISKQEIERKTVDISRVASDIIGEIMDSRPDRDVSIEIEPGLTANADPKLLEVLLSNLLRNAWKFTKKKEKARIRFGAAFQDGKTVYCVRDNGAGFKPEYRERMFLPFQRLHTSDEFEGTGIGLAIVDRIVHRHGGQVWAEGAEGTGASIFLHWIEMKKRL